MVQQAEQHAVCGLQADTSVMDRGWHIVRRSRKASRCKPSHGISVTPGCRGSQEVAPAVTHIGKTKDTAKEKDRERERQVEKERQAALAVKQQLAAQGTHRCMH